MQQKDYYEILGVDKSDTQQHIKEAYRKLALQYHPDRNQGNPAAAAKMKEINESYAVLSDSQKRRQYDSLKDMYGSSAYGQFRQAYSEQDIFRGSDIQQIFEELSKAFGFRGFDEVFRGGYGAGNRTFESKRPRAFGRVFVSPSMGQGVPLSNFPLGGPFGKLVKLGMKKIWGMEWPEKGKDLYDSILIPPDLARSGGKISYFCRMNSKQLIVTIPAGIKAGQQIRLKGMGGNGTGGAEPGDLLVQIRVRGPFAQRIRDFSRRFLPSSSKGQIMR